MPFLGATLSINSQENAVINAVFPDDLPPIIGTHKGRFPVPLKECPQLGHSASSLSLLRRKCAGNFFPHWHVLKKAPYFPGVKSLCLAPQDGQIYVGIKYLLLQLGQATKILFLIRWILSEIQSRKNKRYTSKKISPKIIFQGLRIIFYFIQAKKQLKKTKNGVN